MTAKEIIHEAAWCIQLYLAHGFTWTEIEHITDVPYPSLKNIRAEKKNLSVDVITRLLEASGKELVVRDKENKHGKVQE